MKPIKESAAVTAARGSLRAVHLATDSSYSDMRMIKPDGCGLTISGEGTLDGAWRSVWDLF
jgi:hypothetical protein